MGIRSDVGFALKAALVEAVEANSPWILDDADEVHTNEYGKLYIFRDIKWYLEDSDIKNLYRFLESLSSDDDWLINQACSDFPLDTSGDGGDWNDNPWGMCRHVQASIYYDDASGSARCTTTRRAEKQ